MWEDWTNIQTRNVNVIGKIVLNFLVGFLEHMKYIIVWHRLLFQNIKNVYLQRFALLSILISVNNMTVIHAMENIHIIIIQVADIMKVDIIQVVDIMKVDLVLKEITIRC